MSKALGVAGAGLRFVGLIVLLALGSCGGGKTGSSLSAGLTQPDTWPVHNYQGAARSGSFAVVAVDSTERQIGPLTTQLSLDVKPDTGGTLVSIKAAPLAGIASAYLHLKYDNTLMHPVLTRAGDQVPDDTLFLGITSVPGLITLGLATAGATPSLHGGSELAAVRFEPGPFNSSRRVSVVETTPVTDLQFSISNSKQLVWSYSSAGDYDQNSEVGISDITPVGIYLHQGSASPNWTAAQCADGDGNGEVNLSDLKAIGANYRKAMTGYQVKGSINETGPFSNDVLVPFDLEQFPLPPGGGRRQFSAIINTALDGSWYAVVPMEGGTESSALSNAVQYHGGVVTNNLPPQNLSAAVNGLAVRLTWSAPSTGTPTGYNAYVGSSANMAGAQLINAGAIPGLTFDCPLAISPSGSYFFAVRAIYGASESVNSNVFAFNTASGDPSGLAATQQGNAVQLTWIAPTGPAPDGYNMYVGSDNAMTGAQKMNLGLVTGSPYNCPLSIDPAVEHFFAVKASTGGNEGNYSNIYHYTSGGGGSDTTPPVWQQGQGIKAATPSSTGGTITVSWYVAQDAQTPPVKYLVYAQMDGTPIDYNDPVDIFDAAITSTPLTALSDGTPFQDGQRYVFAVRAQDACVPPNVTTNTNTLFATPQILPPAASFIPAANPLTVSDTASVRVQGEEVPRIVGVNHSANLYYVTWDTSLQPADWTITDLNTTLGVPGRKYHPQLIAIGDEIHLLFATTDTVYEAYGPKDSPATWQTKIIQSALSTNPGITGTGLIYNASGNFLACVFSGKSSTEQMWYSDRDLSGEWTTPVSIMTGNPEIWQCDLAINEVTGEQWAVAANGTTSSSDDLLQFWYTKRANRSAVWDAAKTSGFGGDVMTVDIDPATSQPIVACAEVTHVNIPLAGDVPVSNATIFTWTGNAWARDLREAGDAVFDQSAFTLDTILTGQDPQIIFSPSGKTIALWSKLDFFADLIESTATLTGEWHYSQRPTTTWSPPQSLLPNISSSNSVTAGDSFQHCVTCNLGPEDSDDYQALGDKYSKRNDYVEGTPANGGGLYYLYKPWS